MPLPGALYIGRKNISFSPAGIVCPWLLYAKVVVNVMSWGHDVGV